MTYNPFKGKQPKFGQKNNYFEESMFTKQEKVNPFLQRPIDANNPF